MFAMPGLPAPIVPRAQRRGLWRRLALVCAVAPLIAIVHWTLQPGPTRSGFDVALVYAFAISVLTWLGIDFARFALRLPLRAAAPGYWPPPRRAALLIVAGVAAGYLVGITLGDLYAGRAIGARWQGDAGRSTGLVLSSVAISVAFIVFFIQQGRSQALRRQARDAQLRLLQSQLEPHMLFNTLANLRVLIALDPPRAQAMLDRLIGFLRATLDASRSDSGTLAAEFDRIADYLALMQVRMGARLSVALDLPEALRDAAVPPLLLQPLVENAIRHGLEPHAAGGRVEVAARRDAGLLVLTVRDNGAGIGAMPAQRASPAAAAGSPCAGGYGLQHVREQLRALHGERAQLVLHAAHGGGTVAEINLPLDLEP